MLDKKLSEGDVFGSAVTSWAAAIEAATSVAVGSEARHALGVDPEVQPDDVALTGTATAIEPRRNDAATRPRFNTAPP